MRNRNNRPGFTLLEVIIAAAILATAAISAIVLARQSALTVQQTEEADKATRAASNFLEKVSLWPREDLDRHLGERHEGEWILYIDRPHPLLYRVVLYDSTAKKPVLETALFRPEEAPIPPRISSDAQ